MPFRKDRNSSGGGVIVYTNNNLNVKSRPDLDFDGEVIWLEIDMPRCKLLLCTVYRPPNAEVSFWDNFQQSVENALNSSQYVVITGDLNIDLLTNHENRLVNLIRLHGLKNLITEPTRISNTRQSLLDPILVSTHCDIHDSFVIPVNRLMSDHEATIVFVKFPLNCNKTYKRLVYDYKNADFETCNECISSFNWETILSIDNSMDKNCQNFTDKFIEFIKMCVPQKEVIIRPKDKIWFNSELRKEIRKRDRLHKQARKSKTVHDITKYKKQRNHVNNLKKFAKEQFYLNANNLLNEFSSSNPKSYWSLVKKLIKTQGNSISISQLKNDDGVLISDDFEKTCILNNFFSSISTLDDTNVTTPNFPSRTHKTLDTFRITPNQVRDILQILKLGKASGPDYISHQMLKKTCDTVCVPLSLLFNLSFSKAQFPTQWKIASVMPLFKNGDKTSASNYRPIALLSTVGKVFERIVFKEVFNYLISNKLLYKFQSGFLPGHSTVHQLIEIYYRICMALDDHCSTFLIFCDISKAFDRVWHLGLLLKLKAYGINGQLYNWFESYLSNRKQSVFIGNEKSPLQCTNAGVPQGSVLGPLLFLLYVNDIADDLVSLSRLFADDTSLSYSSLSPYTIEDIMNTDLEALANWSEQWLIKFNPKKTKALSFCNNNNISNDVEIQFQNETVEFVSHHKHLGITFDNDGKFHTHINNIVNSTTKRLCALRQLKYVLNRNFLSRIYLTFIRPIMEYACELWDGCSQNDSDNLEKLQLEAGRIVTGLPLFASRESIYYETGCELLSDRRKTRRLSIFYNIHNKSAPDYTYENTKYVQFP